MDSFKRNVLRVEEICRHAYDGGEHLTPKYRNLIYENDLNRPINILHVNII